MVKESPCQGRRCRKRRFDYRVRKIPWRRKWQPTPVFFPGKSHGQRSLAGNSPGGCKSQTWLSDWAYTYPFIKWSILLPHLRSAHFPRTPEKARPFQIPSTHPESTQASVWLYLPSNLRSGKILSSTSWNASSIYLQCSSLGKLLSQRLPATFLHSTIFQTCKCFTISSSAYFLQVSELH